MARALTVLIPLAPGGGVYVLAGRLRTGVAPTLDQSIKSLCGTNGAIALPSPPEKPSGSGAAFGWGGGSRSAHTRSAECVVRENRT